MFLLLPNLEESNAISNTLHSVHSLSANGSIDRGTILMHSWEMVGGRTIDNMIYWAIGLGVNLWAGARKCSNIRRFTFICHLPFLIEVADVDSCFASQ
jgi:hypothetical protein